MRAFQQLTMGSVLGAYTSVGLTSEDRSKWIMCFGLFTMDREGWEISLSQEALRDPKDNPMSMTSRLTTRIRTLATGSTSFEDTATCLRDQLYVRFVMGTSLLV